MIKKLTFLLILLCITHLNLAHAAVFKCDENGDITFSDKPCKNKAKAQDITEQHYKSLRNNTSSIPSSNAQNVKRMADEMQAERLNRKYSRQINSLISGIEDKKKTRDSELLTLQKQRESIGRGVDDDFDDEVLSADLKKRISKRMIDVEKKYGLEIDDMNKKIDDLMELKGALSLSQP